MEAIKRTQICSDITKIKESVDTLSQVHIPYLAAKFDLYVPLLYTGTADGDTVVKVLRYKSEGGWFDSRWCHWNFSLT
jgi:hypothetical protein